MNTILVDIGVLGPNYIDSVSSRASREEPELSLVSYAIHAYAISGVGVQQKKVASYEAWLQLYIFVVVIPVSDLRLLAVIIRLVC